MDDDSAETEEKYDLLGEILQEKYDVAKEEFTPVMPYCPCERFILNDEEKDHHAE